MKKSIMVGILTLLALLGALSLTACFDSGSGDNVVINFMLDENVSYKTQTYLRYGVISMPQNPKKEGYTFSGWFSEKECTNRATELDGSFKRSLIGDKATTITVYAKWVPYAHTHSFGSYQVDIAATCEANGEESRHCTDSSCPERSDVRILPKLGHLYNPNEWVYDVAPTYEKEGLRSHICTRCAAHIMQEVAPKLVPATLEELYAEKQRAINYILEITHNLEVEKTLVILRGQEVAKYSEEYGVAVLTVVKLGNAPIACELVDKSNNAAALAIINQSGEYSAFEDAVTKIIYYRNSRPNDATQDIIAMLKDTILTEGGAYYNGDKTTIYGMVNEIMLEEFVMPYTVTHIGYRAFFYNSTLTTIELSPNLESVGDEAFYHCVRLAKIAFPISLTRIGEMAFFQCEQLIRIMIPQYMNEIGSGAFGGCAAMIEMRVNQYNEKFADHGTQISDGSNCIVEVKSQKLTSGCKNTIIPNSVVEIGAQAFEHCRGLTAISHGDNIKVIGDSAYAFCINATSLTIGKNVETIGEGAFFSCGKITQVVVPISVKTMKRAFNNKNLTIYALATEQPRGWVIKWNGDAKAYWYSLAKPSAPPQTGSGNWYYAKNGDITKWSI